METNHHIKQRPDLAQTSQGIPDTTESNGTGTVVCTCCKTPIADSSVMKVNNNYWHQSCLRCCLCATPLLDSCFFDKQQRLYCKNDYLRLVESAKCCYCTATITANDLVYRVFGRMYHIRCFICYRCNIPLRKGDQYILHGNGDLVCKVCTDESGLHIGPDIGCRRDKREVKRPRTVLSSVQRRVFKEAFDRSPRPCRKEREKLSSQTGLSVRVVQVWFQNQRAKVKKLARRKANKEKNQSLSHNTSESDMDDKNYYEEGEAKVTSSIEGYPDVTSPNSCDLVTLNGEQNFTTLIPALNKKRYQGDYGAASYGDHQQRIITDGTKTYQLAPNIPSTPGMFYEGAPHPTTTQPAGPIYEEEQLMKAGGNGYTAAVAFHPLNRGYHQPAGGEKD